jgi:hypothetical protein
MPVETSIEIDPRAADNVMAVIQRGMKDMNKGFKPMLAWTGREIMISLGARTKQSQKKRKIVKRPRTDPNFIKAMKDKRYAQRGVLIYSQRRTEPTFRPISERNITKSPARIIGRRGFAKKSWRFLKMRTGKGGRIYIDGIPNMGETRWSGGTADPTLTIDNRVSYITDHALIGREAAITNAMGAATTRMMKTMDRKLAEKLGAK